MNKDIIAIFTESGIILDTETAKGDNYFFDERFLEEYRQAQGKALLYFGFEDEKPFSESLGFVHRLCALFIEKTSKCPDIEFTHKAPQLDEDEIDLIIQNVPYSIGSEFINEEWLKRFWNNLAKAFATEIALFDDNSVEQFFLTHNSHINVAGRIFFHLVENKDSSDYPFAFLATYSKSAGEGKAEHLPLQSALQEFKGEPKKLINLISTVSKAAQDSEFVSQMLESGELFSPLCFSQEDAYIFLKETPIYEECGIMCRIPDWWKKNKSRVKTSAKIGDTGKKYVGLQTLMDIVPLLNVDGVEISRYEVEQLLLKSEGLAFIKGKWVEINHGQLQKALMAFEQIAQKHGEITLAEAMRMQLGLSKSSTLNIDKQVELLHGKWLKNVFESLSQNKGKRASVDLSGDFRASLRHYQQEGLDWLASMKNFGFGALLADDMGLGKTIQILALLDYFRPNGLKTLLVIPASLIGNWRHELEKFAPKIKFALLHGAKAEVDESADLCITTYTTLSRILDGLKQYKWDMLILDEAQAIKNPQTLATKAVKSISAEFKIAMTGTPVENKLSDLWSIFDYLNSGLLGSMKEFSFFVKSLKSSGNYGRLRKVVSPFILRRLKTDKSIINDLPDKIELKNYTSLSKKQIVLYNSLIDELKIRLENTEGIDRKGLILASLIKIKQICNHPDQYLGQTVFKPADSGKFLALGELCEVIHQKRERMLVFTQFREMCQPLSDFLEIQFGKKGLVLHGSVPVNKRTELVDRFNGEQYVPYMVLSLKAGGVGLNLTSANHVIHFDRWWNPAVENQATDRAFRIGQTKDVLVHKLISLSTIEEKIDCMIEDKQALSSQIVASSGEGWITEMSNKELLDLFRMEK